MTAATSIHKKRATEHDFMKGKALAAAMVRENMSRDPGKGTDLCASYRDPGRPQDNFTEAFLRRLICEPSLLPGFSAALSCLLVEGMERLDFARAAATISYEACTQYHPWNEQDPFDAYTAPELDQQLAEFGVSALMPSSSAEAELRAGQ